MKLEIDIKEKDIEALKNKVMTIEDMYKTLEGRVICEIVSAATCSCQAKREEWIETEQEPQYKKGDIVIIDEKGSLWIFVRETSRGNAILTRNVLDVDVEIGVDFGIKTNDIVRKVGNIYDKRRNITKYES